MHNCLVADVRLAGMLDTHPCFISPFLFCLIVRCSRRWSLGVQEQKIPGVFFIVEFPPRPGVVWRFPGRRPRLFDRCCFCASLLKATLYSLCLYSDTIAFADFVFLSSCIRALVAPGLYYTACIIFIC